MNQSNTSTSSSTAAPPVGIPDIDLEWFEVWFEVGGASKFNFLLLAKEKSNERYLILDIYRQYELVVTFDNHHDAEMFLLEDEFSKVAGRTYAEDF